MGVGGRDKEIPLIYMSDPIYVVIDLSQFYAVKRYAEKNRPILLKTAAQRYQDYLKRRFRAYSARGFGWLELSKRRLREKERDQFRTGVRRISWILRETDQLLNAIEVKPDRDQYMVGIVKNKTHRGFKIVRGREVSNNIGMARLAEIHQFGRGHVPARPFMVLPNRSTQLRMVRDVRDEYNKIIRANRRKGKNG